MQSRDTASLESLRNIAQALRSLVTYLVENNLDELSARIGSGTGRRVQSPYPRGTNLARVAKMPENVSSIEGDTLEEVINKLLRDKLAKEKR